MEHGQLGCLKNSCLLESGKSPRSWDLPSGLKYSTLGEAESSLESFMISIRSDILWTNLMEPVAPRIEAAHLN